MIPLHVGGVGMSAPGLAAPPLSIPSLPPALRRRASALTVHVCQALAQAAAEANVQLGAAPLILGSAYGEISAAVEIMRSFDEDLGLPSPTRFHNSVHNTPVAYASIAFGNRGFSTALAAGAETVAMALVEAAGLLAERGGDVLVVLADEPVPSPLAPERRWPMAAAALHLSATPTAATRAHLSLPRRGHGTWRARAPFEDHPCAGAFALVAALAAGGARSVALGPGNDGWMVDVEAFAP